VTTTEGAVLHAHLEHPDALPRQREFPVQGWVASREQLRAAFVEGPSPTPLDLRFRPDVVKALPGVPYQSGFFGLGRAAQVVDGEIGVRFVFDSGSEVRRFHMDPELAAAIAMRGKRLERIYDTLRCIRCLSGFPAGEYQSGTKEIRCATCGAAYDAAQGLFDLLPDDLRAPLALGNEGNISRNHYDGEVVAFVEEDPQALVLDCGAGFRQTEYPNVVNLELWPYRTTDVLGDSERLPFKDESFDGVLSLAVLERVKNPIASAREIFRVLKPGGKVLAVVPLLAPVHAYPHHHFNMTAEGLASLFTDGFDVLDQRVPESGLPIWALVWMLRSWMDGLPEEARPSFADMRVRDLLGEAPEYLERDFVRALPRDKNFELASTTQIVARKRV
jgi:SAM-dependent methyltransferase